MLSKFFYHKSNHISIYQLYSNSHILTVVVVKKRKQCLLHEQVFKLNTLRCILRDSDLTDIQQRSANYSSQSQSGLLLVFINEVLLEHRLKFKAIQTLTSYYLQCPSYNKLLVLQNSRKMCPTFKKNTTYKQTAPQNDLAFGN